MQIKIKLDSDTLVLSDEGYDGNFIDLYYTSVESVELDSISIDELYYAVKAFKDYQDNINKKEY